MGASMNPAARRAEVMSAHLQIVAGADQRLTPEQRKFNQLLQKIDRARAELLAWNEALPLFAQAHAQRVRPLLDQVYDQQLRIVHVLDGHLAGKGWSRKQRQTMRELVCGLASQLIDNERSDEARVAELKALHDRHADTDYDTGNRAAMAGMKDLFETIAGVDLGDRSFESEEELMRHAHEQWSARAEQAAAAAPKRRQRRPSAAQQRREQEEQEAGQSVREVYRKLVGALHPDRADDEDDRVHRTAMMQRVNQAYEARDILALFALQLEIEQVDAAHVARATSEKARHYNRLLTEQLAQIQAEVAGCQVALRMQYGLDPHRRLQPDKLGGLIETEVRELRLALADAERDLRQLGDPAGTRRWLALMARQLEYAATFDDGLPF